MRDLLSTYRHTFYAVLCCVIAVCVLVSGAAADTASVPDGQGVLYFTVMVHLEGWDDDDNQAAFEKHAGAGAPVRRPVRTIRRPTDSGKP